MADYPGAGINGAVLTVFFLADGDELFSFPERMDWCPAGLQNQ